MVLIKNNNVPPIRWALGRVIAVHTGTDEVIRVVSVKTLKDRAVTIHRAVTIVCLCAYKLTKTIGVSSCFV